MLKEKLVIIDGHALIHRAYHAIPPLTTKKGELVNAVYGFTSMLLNVIRELKPKYLAVAFDLPGKTKRHEEFESYKANRPAAPEDLISQFQKVHEIVRALNIPALAAEGYEADDVIGTIVKSTPENIENIIVTGDKDELQLIDSRTKVYTMRRGFTDTVIYDQGSFKEKYGFLPYQFVDYKALRGDPSDNIPGVSGIGEKTALELIQKYGSLDNIYQNLHEIKPAVAAKLQEQKDLAYLSQKLSRIETGIDIRVDLSKCLVHDYDKNEIFKIFQELGFKSLLSRLPAPEVSQTKETKLKKIRKTNYVLIDTAPKLKKLISELKKQKSFAIDTETNSLFALDAKLVGLSISFKPNEAYYIPLGHHKGSQIELNQALKMLTPILESANIGKVGHNLKFDYLVLSQHGIKLKPIIFDTMIAAYLLNPNARAQKLEDLTFSELGIESTPISKVIGSDKNQISFAEVAIPDALAYACEDADLAWQLFLHLAEGLKKAGLAELNEQIEVPLIPVLAEMERAGFKIDAHKLTKLSQEVTKEIKKLEAKIKRFAGADLNINSPIQLQTILFEKLKLQEKIEDIKELKRVKNGGFSTSASELEKLRDVHPIIEAIFNYRELSKLKNTYIDVLPKLVNKKTGRIHTSFNQAITQTGRLSSSDPNLQNIPIRTETGQKIRQAFVAENGHYILSADYSQIELRVVAHIAKVKKMIEFFQEGRDIHTETAAKVYEIPEEKITPQMRRVAKIINFGILYGVSPHGLKQQTGIAREEGKKLIDRYFKIYPEIQSYSKKMIEQARQLGYVETIFGRRRFLPEINSSNFAARSAAERMAINMPIQGTAADLIKLAMIDIAKELSRADLKAKMILQVHDELVFEVAQKEVERLAPLVKEKMEKVVQLAVPIKVAIAWGKNWQSAK